MPKISAKNLASGDLVKFPRLGWRRILRLTGKGTIAVSFCFDDKVRTFPIDKILEAEPATDTPVPQSGEILRLDRGTNRVSVISPSLFGFSAEIGKSFKALRGRVSTFDDIAALDEIKRGATLYTELAVYFMPHDQPIERRRAA